MEQLYLTFVCEVHLLACSLPIQISSLRRGAKSELEGETSLENGLARYILSFFARTHLLSIDKSPPFGT